MLLKFRRPHDLTTARRARRAFGAAPLDGVQVLGRDDQVDERSRALRRSGRRVGFEFDAREGGSMKGCLAERWTLRDPTVFIHFFQIEGNTAATGKEATNLAA